MEQTSRSTPEVTLLASSTMCPSNWHDIMDTIFLQAAQFTYKVKIINPRRKSNEIVRYLHYHSRFNSATNLPVKLIEEFKGLVPDKLSFNVGYLEGQQHNRIRLCRWKILRQCTPGIPREISLFGVIAGKKIQGEERNKRKKWTLQHPDVKRKRKNWSLLMKKYGENAKVLFMNRNGLHGDLDKPPDIPAF